MVAWRGDDRATGSHRNTGRTRKVLQCRPVSKRVSGGNVLRKCLDYLPIQLFGRLGDPRLLKLMATTKGGYPLASFLAQVQCLRVSVVWTLP